MSVSSGDDILLARSSSAMEAYFGDCYSEFEHVLTASSAISQNGDDAIELFEQGVVIETFGDVNTDGTGQEWDYEDSWAYKVDGIRHMEVLIVQMEQETNAAADCPYPLCGIEVSGCTDPTALNYNENVSTDDGSCEYPVDGCTDTLATNYNPLATSNDGSCTYDIALTYGLSLQGMVDFTVPSGGSDGKHSM